MVIKLPSHVGDRPVEVLVNNAGFGSYGPFAEADPEHEADEVAVDVSAVVTLARAFLPGMLARGGGGILNVASEKGRAVIIPAVRNKVIAESGRFMPREWLTRVSARLRRPAGTASRPPIEVRNETVIHASAERVWGLLTDVEGWPSWYRACRWVRVEATGGAAPNGSAARKLTFRWKAHPVTLRSTVVAADRPHLFAIDADALGLHAERTFTLSPTPDGQSTVVVSHETQTGLLPWLGRMFLAPRLRAANQAMFDDLARAAGHGAATQATPPAPVSQTYPGTTSVTRSSWT